MHVVLLWYSRLNNVITLSKILQKCLVSMTAKCSRQNYHLSLAKTKSVCFCSGGTGPRTAGTKSCCNSNQKPLYLNPLPTKNRFNSFFFFNLTKSNLRTLKCKNFICCFFSNICCFQFVCFYSIMYIWMFKWAYITQTTSTSPQKTESNKWQIKRIFDLSFYCGKTKTHFT